MKQSIKTVISLSTVIFLALSASTTLAASNHYRWLDERGRVVYSDRPPPRGVDYEVVSTRSAFKRIVDAEEGAVPAEVEPTVSNDFEPVEEEGARRSKKNPEMCSRANANLDALTNSDKVQIRNEHGEVRDLTPEETQVELATAKAQIDVYCE